MSNFTITAQKGKARKGTLTIAGKALSTPLFIPHTTGLSAPAVFSETLKELGFPAVYADIYRPLCRAGLDILKPQGLKGFTGLEDFVLFTGSGIGDLSASGSAYTSKEGGLSYASFVDGAKFSLSPETSMRIQKKLGADMFTALYDFPATAAGNKKKIIGAARRSERWLKRATEVFTGEFKGEAGAEKLLFAPITGGANSAIREETTAAVLRQNPPAILQTPAFSGETRKLYFEALAASMALIPPELPTAIIGLQDEAEMLRALELGIDIIIADFPFTDSLAGVLYTPAGKINIKDETYRENGDILCEEIVGKKGQKAGAPSTHTYTYAYMHHLFTTGEILAFSLASVHNLQHIASVMTKARAALEQGGK